MTHDLQAERGLTGKAIRSEVGLPVQQTPTWDHAKSRRATQRSFERRLDRGIGEASAARTKLDAPA